MLSEKQRNWLGHLSHVGIGDATGWHGTPFSCRKRGLTEWVYGTPDGKNYSFDELKEMYGEPECYYVGRNIVGERLTPAGREALEKGDGGG